MKVEFRIKGETETGVVVGYVYGKYYIDGLKIEGTLAVINMRGKLIELPVRHLSVVDDGDK